MKKSLNLLARLAERGAPPRCAVVIVAAGSARRMEGVDKIVADVAGKPLILRTALAFERCKAVQEIIVVTREDLRVRLERMLPAGGVSKLKAVVAGGETRADSVERGIACCDPKCRLIAVHDGARPLVTQRVIAEAIRCAAHSGAAAPAVPVKDTIRVVENEIGIETPDRSRLYAIQTPQVFDADLLRAATLRVKEKKLPVTDDCSAVEALGKKVSITAGDEENLKVTTQIDLAVAGMLAKRRDEDENRSRL